MVISSYCGDSYHFMCLIELTHSLDRQIIVWLFIRSKPDAKLSDKKTEITPSYPPLNDLFREYADGLMKRGDRAGRRNIVGIIFTCSLVTHLFFEEFREPPTCYGFLRDMSLGRTQTAMIVIII